MTLRRHQFAFHSGRNDKNLFSYSADINSAMLKSTTMFRCFECFLNENQSIVAMWSSVVSSSWPSICDSVNRGLTLMVVLTLPTSRIYLKTTLFITCQDSLVEEVDLLLSHAQMLHVSRNKGCIFSKYEHFDLTITSGDKVYRLVTVYRPPPPKKNGFTVERFLSEFCAF